MDKKTPGTIIGIHVTKMETGPIEVTFFRYGRTDRHYRPAASSLERLEKHLAGSKVTLGKSWVTITKWL